MMKKIILASALVFCFWLAQAQNKDFRIFGEITTVDNQIYKGYMIWNGIKTCWIDFFVATKPINPYAHYFTPEDRVFFSINNRLYNQPPRHVFTCRFGNLKTIRLTGEKEIQVELKNGEFLRVEKGNSGDIGNTIYLYNSKESVNIRWDHISEIRFMPSDKKFYTEQNIPLAAIVKSSQGYYKGIITWNYTLKRSAEKIKNTNIFLNRVTKITQNRYGLRITLQNGSVQQSDSYRSSMLTPFKDILVNMPKIGAVIINQEKFNELEMIPLSQLDLPSYDDFKAPLPINGKVFTNKKETIIGDLAYDLDESLDFEVLDGKNDHITYMIPFKFIKSIEPKNYKYSFITLKNGNELSLGEMADVDKENNGVIVFDNYSVPVYIPWEEIKNIILK